MKQFLTPQPKQIYTIAKEFSFLLYPFNVSWDYDDDKKNHPFKGIYSENIHGKIDKKGEFKFTFNLVHGPSVDTHEHNGISWGSQKERMSLRECFIVVDSDSEKQSKFVLPYQEMKAEAILGNVPKEMTYCIFTDFLNNSKNDSYHIPYPKPHDYSVRYEKKEFPNVVTKKELQEIIEYYKGICKKTIEFEHQKFKDSHNAYKIRFDKKIESNIPIEYTLPAGIKFKFIKFEPKVTGRSNKKYKNFVEIEINGFTVYLRQEDFSGIWVE